MLNDDRSIQTNSVLDTVLEKNKELISQETENRKLNATIDDLYAEIEDLRKSLNESQAKVIDAFGLLEKFVESDDVLKYFADNRTKESSQARDKRACRLKNGQC